MIIYDNLCAKVNRVTRQNLGQETHQNLPLEICTIQKFVLTKKQARISKKTLYIQHFLNNN